MGKSTFWPVLLLTIVAVVIAVLSPDGSRPDAPRYLPWEIEPLANGNSRVFGIVLGESTLGDLEHRIGEEAEVSLFAPDKGKRVVEGYFNSVALSGLKARMVATLDFDEQQLAGLFDRGARIKTLAVGMRKVTLSDDDVLLARATPIVALTYLPRADLKPEVLLRRFGEPARRVREDNDKVVHWLYPGKGLDLVVNEEGKEVLQYVPPRHFDRLLKPLEKFNQAIDPAI